MKLLLTCLRRLSLGLALIVAAAAVLLFSDPAARNSPKPAGNAKVPKVALVNFSTTITLEEGERGVVAGLAEGGFVPGRTMQLLRFNAHTDRATAVAIAKDVVSRDFDLILTCSTAMLQAIANANKDVKRTHVFAITTDPWGAGVGISRENPEQHPPYMTGYGSLQPVAGVFRLAREARPDLKKVGVVWNPSEPNSEASTTMARHICQELGIELVEVTVDSSAGVGEAAGAVVGRGIEAIWAGGDVTVAVAFDSVVAAARNGHIPVFTNMPSDAGRGALFALGADYFEVGRTSGVLAARVLKGTNPADVPVENLLPKQLAVNTRGTAGLAPSWSIPPDWLTRADIVVLENGTTRAKSQARRAESFVGVHTRFGRPARVAFIQLTDSPTLDQATEGVVAGLAAAGLKPDADYELQKYSAQGDLSQLPQMLAVVKNRQVDLVLTSTTPAMIAAAKAIRDIPIVFTVASYPPAVGVFAEGQRQENLVGVYDDPPLAELIELARKREGAVTKVGIVWNPAEPNSEHSVKKLRRICAQQGIELIEKNAVSVNELSDATSAACQAGAQILVISADNVAASGLPTIVSTTQKYRVPIYSTEPDMVRRGAAGAVGDDFFEWGKQTGLMAAKVLAGVPLSELGLEKTAIQRTAVAEDGGNGNK
jgi:ABC-type uncharacterized transport system substrate-binding protein